MLVSFEEKVVVSIFEVKFIFLNTGLLISYLAIYLLKLIYAFCTIIP